MRPTLSISVLIPTLGREKELIDTVLALTLQTRLPDEIIVLDQNQPVSQKVVLFLDTVTTVKHIQNVAPGVVANYNRCLALSTSDIVLFLDDDVIPDPHLIEYHLENYQSINEKIGGVAGRVLQPKGDLPVKKIKKFAQYHWLSGSIINRFNADQRREVDHVQGCNMSFLRSALLDCGGFDEGFIGNGYFFEADAALRVRRKYKIIFDPRAQLTHLMAPMGGARINDKTLHTYYFVRNGIRLYRKHSPKISRPMFIFRMAVHVFAKAVWNRNARILSRGLKGIVDGLCD